MRIYIDTNIFLDYLLARHREDEALNVFSRTLSCEFTIIISDHLLRELYGTLDGKAPNMLFSALTPKLMKIITTEKDRSDAGSLDMPFADALHVVLARRAGAKRIVTRNLRDFRDVLEACLPEDI